MNLCIIKLCFILYYCRMHIIYIIKSLAEHFMYTDKKKKSPLSCIFGFFCVSLLNIWDTMGIWGVRRVSGIIWKKWYSPDIGDRLVREGVVISGAWVVVVDVVVVGGIHVVKFCAKIKPYKYFN